MAAKIFDDKHITLFDGALGTMLQTHAEIPKDRLELAAIEHAEILTEIHRQYVNSGAQIIMTNTFGANGKKLARFGVEVVEAVMASVKCAKAATDGNALVALDVGPLGEMLKPAGSVSFEEAYNIFAEMMQAGANAGADLILIETMTDVLEVKAAVLAAKENTSLPVLASMSFEEDGRTFTGVSVEAFAAAIEPLGVDGLGLNCSLGPQKLVPLFKRLCALAQCPVFLQPNNGLPNPATDKYEMRPSEFLEAIMPCLDMGVSGIGGCCGTTPETIELLAKTIKNCIPAKREILPYAFVCGGTKVVPLDGVLCIGERINPTGKKALRQALQSGDIAAVQTLAVQQEQAGADILDVNVGAPDVDEVEMLPAALQAVQAVSGLPVQIDSNNPKALEAALRVCIGKPIVNSTTAEKSKLAAILPLCKKYGAAVVGLTITEDGIPMTAAGRCEAAKKILDAALKEGLRREDILIDCLTLSVAAESDAAGVTLQAVRKVSGELGLRTVLGVSNISFGMPARAQLNRTFLAMALAEGLNAAIINPSDEEMMATVHCARVMHGQKNAQQKYIELYGAQNEGKKAVMQPVQSSDAPTLKDAIVMGLKQQATQAAAKLIEEGGGESLAIVNEYLVPALDEVGKEFEVGRIFLPQLLASAGAAQAAFEEIKKHMTASEASGPPVVIATVKGDVHDIGKNIARVLLENYGFTVTDLGRDVPPKHVVDAVIKTGAKLAGLSALMTTTLPAMEETIREIKKAAPQCKVLVGGAVLTEDYAKRIGADFYAKDAVATAEYAKRVCGNL